MLRPLLFFLLLLSITFNIQAQANASVYIDTLNYAVAPIDPDVYHVPVKTIGFSGMIALDISIQTANGASIDGLAENFLDPNFTSVSIVNDSTIKVIYLDLIGQTIELADHAPMFVLAIRQTNQETCIPFEIQEVMLIHEEAPVDPIEVTTVAGSICFAASASISGLLLSPDGQALDSVEVVLIQGGEELITVSDAMGHYVFHQVPIDAGAITIRPMAKLNEDTRAERIAGIDQADVMLIIDYLLEKEPISNPYLLIAADTNKDAMVSTLDLIELQAYILENITAYQHNSFYRFCVSSVVFSEPSMPFDEIQTELTIPNLTEDINNLDFIGIRIGDVD